MDQSQLKQYGMKWKRQMYDGYRPLLHEISSEHRIKYLRETNSYNNEPHTNGGREMYVYTCYCVGLMEENAVVQGTLP